MPAMAFPGRPGTSRSASLTPASPPGVESEPPSDWPRQATKSIVNLVDAVRDKTTGPAVNAVQWVIYGTVMALLATPILILLLIAMMRATEGGLSKWFYQPMWLVYLIYGTIFTSVGRVLWAKAAKPPTHD